MAVVVFPTPPFWLATARIRADIWSKHLNAVERASEDSPRTEDRSSFRSDCSTWNMGTDRTLLEQRRPALERLHERIGINPSQRRHNPRLRGTMRTSEQ